MTPDFYKWLLTIPTEYGVEVTKAHRGCLVQFSWLSAKGKWMLVRIVGVCSSAFDASVFLTECPKWVEEEIDRRHMETA